MDQSFLGIYMIRTLKSQKESVSDLVNSCIFELEHFEQCLYKYKHLT